MKTASFLAALAAISLSSSSISIAQSTGAISFGKPKAENPADLVTVEAKGQGESVEAAKKDAVRNAIKMVVGELVDAKTLVENDELVQDKILTLSNAMVEKADYGDAKPIGDGLFEVPVKAVVKKGRLNQELKAVGIATGAVAGDSLAAELFSGKERVANAEKFLAERFHDFPGNVVEAVMLAKDDGTPNVEVDTDKGHVFANVGVRVNMENYARWTKALCELLGHICQEKEAVTITFSKPKTGTTLYYMFGTMDTELLACEQITRKPFSVIVATPLPGKEGRLSWPATIYHMDSQMWESVGKVIQAELALSGSVNVTLKDEDGDPVCSANGPLGGRSKPIMKDRLNHHFSWRENRLASGEIRFLVPIVYQFTKPYPQWNLCMITPALRLGTHSNLFSGMSRKSLVETLRIDLGEVSEDDLAKVAGFEVKVEYKYPSTKRN